MSSYERILISSRRRGKPTKLFISPCITVACLGVGNSFLQVRGLLVVLKALHSRGALDDPTKSPTNPFNPPGAAGHRIGHRSWTALHPGVLRCVKSLPHFCVIQDKNLVPNYTEPQNMPNMSCNCRIYVRLTNLERKISAKQCAMKNLRSGIDQRLHRSMTKHRRLSDDSSRLFITNQSGC